MYSGKRLFWHYCLQLSFVFKSVSQKSFSLFYLGDKGLFYQSSLGNEVDFTDIMNVSPNILAKNENFKKLKHGFVDERTMTTMTIASFCHWKTLVPFCLQKKIPEKSIFNNNSELSQNLTEKQIMPLKTTVTLLFNDI